MYRAAYQKDYFTLFYSVGKNPTSNWAMTCRNGYGKRVYDDDLRSMVMELMGSNVSTTYMTSPANPKSVLGIKFPFLVLLVKNMEKYFTFEIKILDDQKFTRRFNISNFQGKTAVQPFFTSMPMCLSPGWTQVNFNLKDFCRRAYGTGYMETLRLTIHANIRVRRVYFTDRLVEEDDLPNEYRLMPKPKGKAPSVSYKVPAQRPTSPAKSVVTEVSEPEVPEAVGDVAPAGVNVVAADVAVVDTIADDDVVADIPDEDAAVDAIPEETTDAAVNDQEEQY